MNPCPLYQSSPPMAGCFRLLMEAPTRFAEVKKSEAIRRKSKFVSCSE